MTREERNEAIVFYKMMVKDKHLNNPKYIKWAIEALEQEPCDDCIRREDALMALTGEWKESPIEILSKAIRRIRELPPVKPQYTEAEIQKMQDLESVEIQTAYEIGKEEGSSENPNKWIPANQPPKISGRYIVTRHFFNNDFVGMANYGTDLRMVDKYDFPKHKAGWYKCDSEYGNYELDDVVAWMPSPEPMKVSSTGEDSTCNDCKTPCVMYEKGMHGCSPTGAESEDKE